MMTETERPPQQSIALSVLVPCPLDRAANCQKTWDYATLTPMARLRYPLRYYIEDVDRAITAIGPDGATWGKENPLLFRRKRRAMGIAETYGGYVMRQRVHGPIVIRPWYYPCRDPFSTVK